MNRLSEINEGSQEINSSDKIKIVEPNSKMSDAEVNNFWKTEFDKVIDNTEVDSVDRLLSEAFDCAEDEIVIDFYISENLYSFLENFRPDNWESKDEVQRVAIIKEAIKMVGEKMGLKDIPGLSFYDAIETDCGGYNPDNNEISINRNNLDDPIRILNTVMHELRHAYQQFRAEKMETWEDKLFGFNYENYIEPVPLSNGNYLFYTDYRNQYVEVDARAFANKFTEAIKHE